MKTAIYIRISKEDTRSGKSMSPEMQEEYCRKYCDLKQLDNIEVFSDFDLGGRIDNRPEFVRMLALVEKKQIDNIVVYAMARYSRSRQTFLSSVALFRKKKVTFHSVKEMIDLSTSTGRLIADVLSSLNEFEVEQISERTSDNLQLRKSQLRVYGKCAPYGFSKLEGRLIIDAGEAKIVQAVFDMNKEGKGLRATMNALNKDFKPREGKAFYIRSVQNILGNKEFYEKNNII